MSADPTTRMPVFVPVPEEHYRHERLLLAALVLAYIFAGAVLGFACIVLANAAEQINNAPFCRRI